MVNVPGFVHLSCTFQDARKLYFVLTYATNGELSYYINKYRKFSKSCAQHYAAELVLACENMHSRGIVHRDLKPENILFDSNWHTLIADFGSAKIVGREDLPLQHESCVGDTHNSSSAYRSRKNSFVGTAQYVSPEILRGKPATRAADLWALGCIVYQVISGLLPFRAVGEYQIFQKILKLDLSFDAGFDRDAKDLVERLLKIEPDQRLGAQDPDDCYTSIRSHPFFAGINWQNLRKQMPPPMVYHPNMANVDRRRLLAAQIGPKSNYKVPDDIEPGLDDKQMTRLLGIQLGTNNDSDCTDGASECDGTAENTTNSINKSISPKNNNRLHLFYLSPAERAAQLEQQRKTSQWHKFVDNELIVKQGLLNKGASFKKNKRMLLLTTGPRLFYVDADAMVKKGEIPMSANMSTQAKNFKLFYLHTPSRTYDLEDLSGYALEWCKWIDEVREYIKETSTTADFDKLDQPST